MSSDAAAADARPDGLTDDEWELIRERRAARKALDDAQQAFSDAQDAETAARTKLSEATETVRKAAQAWLDAAAAAGGEPPEDARKALDGKASSTKARRPRPRLPVFDDDKILRTIKAKAEETKDSKLPGATMADIAEGFGVNTQQPPPKLREAVANLEKDGKVKRTGKVRGTRYHPA